MCAATYMATPSATFLGATNGSGLTNLEPDEPGHLDARLGEHLLDGLLVVRHRGLLEQHEVLEEPVHPAVDDPGQGGFRLALLAGGLLGDAPLGGDDVVGNLVTGDGLRP